MALFGRRRSAAPEPSADGPRDANLPMLSVEQAAALGQLAEQAFRQHGVPATYDGAASLHAGGRYFGLHNLATVAARTPWRRWPTVVDNHVRALQAAERAGTVERPPDPEQLLLKLRAAGDLPNPVDFDAASPFPGLLALPAIDTPTHVQELLSAAHLEPLGGLEQLRDRALQNLRARPVPEHSSVLADDARADSEIHLFTGDDYFVASRALVLDALLRSTLRVERPAHGCLVAVPNRHVLAVHVLSGAGVVAAMRALVGIAESQVTGAGPITDEVFYVPADGPIEQVTQRDDGELRVVVDGRLAEAFARLGLLGE